MSKVTRREFLATSAVAGAAATGTRIPSGKREHPAEWYRIPSFELEEKTISDLQAGMKDGRYTARSIAEAYLARIQALDRNGPRLNQVLETNPDALDIAEALDRERKERGPRGPMHGIPVLLKDNIGTADKMQTTAGSLALLGAKPRKDAHLVERLRAAGAVILGKTNLSEWANFRSTHSSSGWSGRGGQGKNPYALDRSPCGSSSGSGAATAANFTAVAIGTETDGSVVCPSAANGLVGIKPTLGLVSRSGIIPLAHSQDTAGPMCRSVSDAATLLTVMAGSDPRDPATGEADSRRRDYTRSLEPGGLNGARIGVMRQQFSGYSPETDRIFEDSIKAIEQAGATIVDPADHPTAGQYGDAEFEVLLYEFKADINRYLEELGDATELKTLADLIRFNESHSDTELRYFGQEIFLMAADKGPLSDKAYKEALEKSKRLTRAEGLDKLVTDHKLDAVIAPTGAPAWTVDLVNGDHFLGGSSSVGAVSGYPSITVPAGHSFGLPVGLTFFGRAYEEAKLIRYAYAFEQETRVRRAPKFRAHAEW